MAIRMTGMISGLDTDSLVQELVSAYSKKKENIVKSQTKLSWKQDAWKELNTKVYSLYKNVGNMRYSSGYNLKSTTVSDSTKATVTAANGAVNGTQTLKVKQLATSGYLTGAALSTGSGSSAATATANTTLSELGFTDSSGQITVNGTSISVDGSTKISEVVSKLAENGVNASFDSNNGRIFVSAKESGADADFSLEGSDDAVLSALGLKEDDSMDESVRAKRIAGQDAEIYLNGAKFTSSSNTFNVNGLTIKALGVTGTNDNDAITITTATDTQGIYDKIKSFLSDYNDLINEMTSLYNADSAKGYEPLTDEEKEAMSDDEVEKWEAKIKASLLRRDGTLSSVSSTMKNAMAGAVYVKDGEAITYNSSKGTYSYKGSVLTDSSGNNITSSNIKSYAESQGFTGYNLSSFGIQTLGYMNAEQNEQNAYHIDGDEDDAATSGNKDKLMAMLEKDPDAVVGFMKGLATNLYNSIDAKMKSSTLSSAYTVYNDKQMAQEYSDYTKSISDWEDKLSDLEDYYYDKFSAMETALAKLQEQTSSLAGLLGS